MDHSDDSNSTEDTRSSTSSFLLADLPEIDETLEGSSDHVAASLQNSWAARLHFLFRPDIGSSIDPSLRSCFGCRPGDPAIIRFPAGWGSHHCPMLEWYHAHRKRSQVFRKFQYRKERQKPFCHEFIILILEDGGICRIERLGDPNARVGAVTRDGTKAFDVIQMHPPEAIGECDKSSDVVMEILLPHKVDIIQVLAICFCIKQHERASRYTLQRYNCYFFSLTILLVLTRLTSGWERFPQDYTWDLMIPELSNSLISLSTLEDQEALAFRITRLLTPERNVPTDIFLEEFRPLVTSDDARDAFALALHSELWSTSLKSALERVFLPLVFVAARETARHRYVGQLILEAPHSSKHVLFARSLLSIRSHLTGLGPGSHKIAERLSMQLALQAYRETENPGILSCLGAKLKRLIYGTLLGTYTGLRSCHSESTNIYSSVRQMESLRAERSGAPVYNVRRTLVETGKICFEHIVEHIRGEMLRQEMDHFELQPLANYGAAENNLNSNQALIQALTFLEEHSDLADDEGYTKAVLYAHIESKSMVQNIDASQWRDVEDPSMRGLCTTWDACWRTWLWESTKNTILQTVLDSLSENEPQTLQLESMTDAGVIRRGKLSVTQLQDRVDQRIKAHGERVAANLLGDSVQVREDIRRAMDDVWMTYMELVVKES